MVRSMDCWTKAGDVLAFVALRGALVDELASAGDQFLERLLLLRRQNRQAGGDLLGEAGQDVCIDAVGLGQQPQCLGEVADGPGVDYGDGQTRGE